MPIPKPKKGESKDDFIARCHSAISGEFPDEKQRHAVCLDAWGKRDNERTLVSFRGQVGKIRTAKFKGKERIVIPVTALVEGVMQAENAPTPELVEKDVFARTATSWNGRPVVVNHPRRDGELVSANAPDILENEELGQIFEAEIKDDKLILEAWIDRELVDEKGGEHKDTIDRAAEGEIVEVSIGAFVDVEQREGEFNGRAFEARWINIVPDHLAILEEGKRGACSAEDGCGTNRAAEARCNCGPGCACKREMEEEKRTLHERLTNAIKNFPREAATAMLTALSSRFSPAELSNTSKMILLENALSKEHPNDFVWLIDFFDDRVIYAQEGKLFQRSYSIKNEKNVTFGDDKQEVTPRTEFIVIEEDKEERNMTKKERVKALIASDKTRFEAADEEFLLSLEDGQLEKLEPISDPEPEPEPEPAKATGDDTAPGADAPTEPITAEAYLEAAPADVREVLQEGLGLRAEKRAHYVKVLSENPRNGFSKEDLEKMDIASLAKMAKLADLPDYSARSASSIPEPADDPMKAPPMPQAFDLKAKRSPYDLAAARKSA